MFKILPNEDNESNGVNKFIERAQSLSFWYIDAVQYTDNNDSRFFHYFM